MKLTLLCTFVVILVTLGILNECATAENCGPQIYGEIRLIQLQDSQNENEGAVQICLAMFQWNYIHYMWVYVTTDGWSDTAALVACRELGLPFTDSDRHNFRLSWQATRVSSHVQCSITTSRIHSCFPNQLTFNSRQSVAGIICKCREGEVRLVNGNTHTEGRVVTCVDGQWRTACLEKELTPQEAGYMCGLAGFSSCNASFKQFGAGTGEFYTYTCGSNQIINCTQFDLLPNCDSFMVAGVKCPQFDYAHATITIDGSLATNCQSATSSIDSKTKNLVTTDSANGTAPTSPLFSEGCAGIMHTNTGLGVLTALLTAALVAVVVGWIISCVWLQRKDNKKNKDHTHETESSTHQLHFHNPVYDPGHLQHNHSYNVTASQVTTYSSQGPSYEATGYDILNRSRPHPLTTPFSLHLTDQNYSTLNESGVEHDYHLLEANTEQDRPASV